jgi:hypothetical protein
MMMSKSKSLLDIGILMSNLKSKNNNLLKENKLLEKKQLLVSLKGKLNSLKKIKQNLFFKCLKRSLNSLKEQRN